MKVKNVTLRCKDNIEAAVFSKFDYGSDEVDFELSIEDSYNGLNIPKGIRGRIKRAWKAFWGKPVHYNSVYCDDMNKVLDFLEECIQVVSEK